MDGSTSSLDIDGWFNWQSLYTAYLYTSYVTKNNSIIAQSHNRSISALLSAICVATLFPNVCLHRTSRCMTCINRAVGEVTCVKVERAVPCCFR